MSSAQHLTMGDEAGDEFDSYDDNELLEALECYHQQQEVQTRTVSDVGPGLSKSDVSEDIPSSDSKPGPSKSDLCEGISSSGSRPGPSSVPGPSRHGPSSEQEPSRTGPSSVRGLSKPAQSSISGPTSRPSLSEAGQGSSPKSSIQYQPQQPAEGSNNATGENTKDNASDKEQSALSDAFSFNTDSSSVDPFTSFAHLMKSKYVNVSDLQAQEWCEQQMVYTINAKWGMFELLAAPGAPVKEIELTTPQMKAGTKIHEQKDLEVNSYVQVQVSSREDSWALKMLNTVQSIKRLLILGEPFIREVVVFGMPYDHGTLVMGIIDELRINKDEQLELVEVKTRSNRHRPPGKAQIRTHHVQVMVYKQLVDDLVSGAIDMTAVLSKMKLDPSKTLHEDVLKYARGLDIPGSALNEIMSAALDQFRFLPKVDSLVIEYVPQGGDGKEILMTDRVEFREDWLKTRLEAHFGFWRREKEAPGGVDIEEIWKCNNCQFVDICQWRKKMNDQCLSRRHGNNSNAIATTK